MTYDFAVVRTQRSQGPRSESTEHAHVRGGQPYVDDVYGVTAVPSALL
jgi:hypothetical protein